MIEQASRRDRAGTFTLVMLSTTASVLLLGVALLVAVSEEVAEAALFGRAGTVAVTVGAAFVICTAAVVATRGAGSRVRAVTLTSSIVVAGLVAGAGFVFVISEGSQLSAGVMSIVSAVLIAVGGREVSHAAVTPKAH
ncbi:hypothetical protein ACTI_33480 [Actinoplanes sp. OR16]|uniref:hypothetical protein n=1 Tax=Actinoplanes sp. OR16 TaxID=946334 RepID=UPI000F706D8F|nr:hypothetical protein [Actinoplanes sp. OR16]BBH66663.1 hypothetical protein ACTI_33480 [Actinoplanes sp. OR16]